MSDLGAEIFRSPRRAACDERAFVLAAVGIPCEIASDGAEFLLRVAADEAPRALTHLRQYEQETRIRPAPARGPPLHSRAGAGLGSLIYATTLFTVAYSVSNGLWRLDAFDVGELHAGGLQAGQWWRAWTALTLHLDGAHLAANTVAGMWFGYLAGRLLGAGNSWLLVVLGAGCANWIEGHWAPAGYRAVGASTAVFTSLGLLSAYSWRTRLAFPQRWAARWGPLIAGLILLGWTGTGGGEAAGAQGAAVGVDILAHGLGFAIGLLLGAGAAWQAAARVLERIPQWLAGLAALALLVAAWVRALGSPG